MISEGEALRKAYELHPELLDWDDEDFERAERQQNVNWHLHLNLDAVVLRRASDPALPDGGVIEALQRQGKKKLDAIHMITALLAADLWERMRAPGTEARQGSEDMSLVQAANSETMNKNLNERIRRLVKSKPRHL